MYLYVKSLHIIFVISWFAGLFYAPRLLIYLAEAQDKNETEREIITNQLLTMSSRLWHIITWPAFILALLFGIWLIILNPTLLSMGWFHIKIFLVLILIAYHIKNYLIFKRFSKNSYHYSSNYLRIWNEGATILLFSIVFVVVLKSTFQWLFGTIGLFVLSLLLFFGVRFYKKKRNSNKKFYNATEKNFDETPHD